LTQVEQVKGITYSLDTLLGVECPGAPTFKPTFKPPSNRDMFIVDDHEFANVNGIEYSLDQLIGTSTPSLSSSLISGTATPTSETPPSAPEPSNDAPPKKFGDQIDASVVESERDFQETLVHDASVVLDMGVKPSMLVGNKREAGNSVLLSFIWLPGIITGSTLSVTDDADDVALDAAYEEELDPNTFRVKLAASSMDWFTQTTMKKPTKDMSGGWHMHVTLARALFIKPHLLLLDELTNHLDLGTVVWLEAYLSTYNHILITSHSQDFMDSVCTNIMD
jgi:hypothetical protein